MSTNNNRSKHPLWEVLKKDRGLTIRWAATQLNVSEQHLNNCLNNNYAYGFPPHLLKRVCQLLGIDPEPYLKRPVTRK